MGSLPTQQHWQDLVPLWFKQVSVSASGCERCVEDLKIAWCRELDSEYSSSLCWLSSWQHLASILGKALSSCLMLWNNSMGNFISNHFYILKRTSKIWLVQVNEILSMKCDKLNYWFLRESNPIIFVHFATAQGAPLATSCVPTQISASLQRNVDKQF